MMRPETIIYLPKGADPKDAPEGIIYYEDLSATLVSPLFQVNKVLKKDRDGTLLLEILDMTTIRPECRKQMKRKCVAEGRNGTD